MMNLKNIFLLWAVAFCLHFKMINSTMACSYGARGSLTVYCVGATPRFFRLSTYKFDHLDETLKCLNCTLEDLGEGTFDISGNQIRTLDITNSSIKNISSKAFIGLIFVEKILLSNNPIELILPEAFTGIRKVKVLEMINTVSTLRPKVFQELHGLEVLILRDSKLSVIEQGTFDGLHNLRVLDLSNNELRMFNASLTPLVNLITLKLQNNKIKHIYGSEFNTLKSLLLIDLSVNIIQNFSIDIDNDNNLRLLKLNKNDLSQTGFKLSTFSKLNNLEELDISSNYLRKLPPKFFQGLHHLTKLNLYDNHLEQLSTGSLSGMPHLSWLNLSENSLTQIKVTGNLVLDNIHTLDLSSNKMKTFDYLNIISRMRNLRYINLEDNEFPCHTMRKLEIQFKDDGMEYQLGVADPNCPAEKKTSDEIIEEMIEEFEEPYSKTGFIITLFILMGLILVLLGGLFYIQFFVLYKMGLSPVEIIRKPISTR